MEHSPSQESPSHAEAPRVEKHESVLASDQGENVTTVIQDIVAILIQEGWNNRDVNHIHVALEEAIVNAMKHGNNENAGKLVHVSAQWAGVGDDQEFTATITDEGGGFDPNKLPDPTLPENLEKGGGRGVLLMRHYMDQVRCVIEDGTGQTPRKFHVIMQKSRTKQSVTGSTESE